MPKAITKNQETQNLPELGSPAFKIVKQQQRIERYYLVGHYLSIAAFLVFLVLLLLQQNVPDFFVGMIGSVLGYYLSRKPFE